MAEAIKTDDELRVGDGWRYKCLRCGFEVGIDKSFPKECPGCGSTGKNGWWGHLAPAISQNDVKKDGDSIKTPNEMMSGGIKTQDLILSQLSDAVVYHQRQNKGVYNTTQGRGRPRQAVPDDLILELAGQGFSSRKMVDELAKRGSPGIGYKTIQRRLQESFL